MGLWETGNDQVKQDVTLATDRTASLTGDVSEKNAAARMIDAVLQPMPNDHRFDVTEGGNGGISFNDRVGRVIAEIETTQLAETLDNLRKLEFLNIATT